MSQPLPPPGSTLRLLRDFSVEMTGKDIEDLHEAAPLLPAASRINITFLGNENLEMRLAAARAVLDHGHIPVPHVSARRLSSAAELEELLAALQEVGASKHLFAVGGDPREAAGPYDSSLGIIRSGLLPRYGVEEVAIAGYPEGHPDIPARVLWSEMEAKLAAAAEQDLDASLLTQFSFDVDAVADWLGQVRGRGIDVPVRIGIPGPAGIRRLLGFARRFGIGANAMIVKKYGFSLANLMGTAGPDRFVTELAERQGADERYGAVSLHFYTFGGLASTARWAREFTAAQSVGAQTA